MHSHAISISERLCVYVQVSIAGMEVLVIVMGRMKDRFRPHISTGEFHFYILSLSLPFSPSLSLSLSLSHTHTHTIFTYII